MKRIIFPEAILGAKLNFFSKGKFQNSDTLNEKGKFCMRLIYYFHGDFPPDKIMRPLGLRN